MIGTFGSTKIAVAHSGLSLTAIYPRDSLRSSLASVLLPLWG